MKSEDLNLDKTWVLSLNTGHSCNKASSSSSAYLLQVGYETPDGNGLTFETNDYTGLQFARAPNTWAFWNSADGFNGKTLRPNDGTYFVTFCGGAAEQFWHSKHGQGTPVSC
ncbi:hypothetical protein [Candidatus Nitrosotenuis uzonensis]|uniref:Uncharacterized protein n=1 Tax=Candidatus Nitrosotenuis uzonensis TaxID=1407055 RepID=V6ATZ7_9ARCH|nr:hypothetical protein [Candidatus Nitrosotenuis uzonensis]CDI05918.1 hypothetical protein NITUZ_40084 [Candidatus Nitrosotenuis uzonensis]